MVSQKIELGTVDLDWSDWYAWNEVKERISRRNSPIKNEKGVYEVRRGTDEYWRLTIGKATKLNNRIKKLLRENGKHSEGRKIREEENLSKLYIRWATTTKPCAIEEYLHHEHKKNNNDKIPEYATLTC